MILIQIPSNRYLKAGFKYLENRGSKTDNRQSSPFDLFGNKYGKYRRKNRKAGIYKKVGQDQGFNNVADLHPARSAADRPPLWKGGKL